MHALNGSRDNDEVFLDSDPHSEGSLPLLNLLDFCKDLGRLSRRNGNGMIDLAYSLRLIAEHVLNHLLSHFDVFFSAAVCDDLVECTDGDVCLLLNLRLLVLEFLPFVRFQVLHGALHNYVLIQVFFDLGQSAVNVLFRPDDDNRLLDRLRLFRLLSPHELS